MYPDKQYNQCKDHILRGISLSNFNFVKIVEESVNLF